MARLTGTVFTSVADGSIGPPLPSARVTFEPTSAGPSVAVTADARGRYTADLAAGNYLAAVDHPAGGTSPTWTLIVNVTDGGSHTFNPFLPSADVRLRTLVSSFPGEIGVYALDLTTGREVALNADGPMYLASVSKLALAVGCVDLMSAPSELAARVRLELRHHREETKRIRYHHLGRERTVQSLLADMIAGSDTTATDVLCERYGIAAINDRVARLGIGGIGPLSSMIQLDRRRWSLRDPDAGFLPEFAFSLYRRNRIRAWLDELDLDVPASPDLDRLWEDYLSDRRDQATPRAVGRLLRGIAERTLLRPAWKGNTLLNTVVAAGGSGRFRGIVTSGLSIDGKGGAHHDVRNEAGLVRDAAGSPVAVLVVFTQKFEAPDGEAGGFVKAAGDLALQVLGIDATLAPPPAPRPVTFTSPSPGQAFEPGARPVIRWASAGTQGALSLALEDPNGSTTPISTGVVDDGEWHSFVLPDGLPADDTYRFALSGVGANGVPFTARSARFTVGGTLHVIRPSTGDALSLGSTPQVRWVSSGVEGRVRIRLLHHGVAVATISPNALNDGEWHSWTVPTNLATGGGYQFEVSSVDDPGVSDRSGEFAVGGQIDVTAPTPGQTLPVGSKPQIRWRSRATIGPLRIVLSDGSLGGKTIASRATDDGEWHSWTVPDVDDGAGYRIAILDTGADGLLLGLSDLFQIGTRYEWLTPSVEPVAQAWGPAARPHFFPYGRTAPLRWRRVGPPVGRLRIDLLRGGTVVRTLSSNALDDGEWHSWTPEDDLPPASTYQLRVRGVDRPTASGRSVTFSVGAHVDVHVDQLLVSTGDSPTVRWTTVGVDGPVSIHLLDQSGSETLVSDDARDDGEWHSWTVPGSLPAGRTHRFRVRSNETPEVFGYSEWFRRTA